MKNKAIQLVIHTMKLSVYVFVVQVLALNLLLASHSKGQKTQSVKEAVVSVSLSKASLSDIFRYLESVSDYHFNYNGIDINSSKKQDLDFRNARFSDVLLEISKKHQLGFRQLNDVIQVVKFSQVKQEEIAVMIVADVEISGKITDENGEGLPGATVVEKGTTNGTTTDLDGNYKLNAGDDAVIVISFVGYSTTEIAIAGRSTIDIQMEVDAGQLEEVVVVGFAEQKKENLTGAVVSMGSNRIAGKTVTQASQVLAGEMSGISVRQASGNPGEDDVDIRIRGLGTFSGAGNNPLVMVDGIESSLNVLNPSDIKSISVLKDAASASIYGSKAANGVILVETKSGGSGKPQFSYSTYFGVTKPTSLPAYVDSWTYAEALNEALVNMGSNRRWSDGEINIFRDQSNPAGYPNTPHLKDLYSSGDGTQNKHDLSISGGSDRSQYYFSMGYLKQKGLISNNFYDRYDLRLNVNSQITDKVSIKTILSGNISEREEPAGLDDIITGAVRLNNTIPGRLDDGSYGHITIHHPEASLDAGSFDNTKANYLSSNVNLSWDILPSLQVSALLGYTLSSSKNKVFNAKFDVTPVYGYSPNNLTVTDIGNTNLTRQILVNYDKKVSNHAIHILGGFSRQTFGFDMLQGYRDNLANNTLNELNGASPTNAANSGTASRNKLESYFGRLNYSFDDKYLFEANVRYDGSSRFSRGNRFGVFPSVSAGWKISNEDFFQESIPAFINHLKIRGSWGRLGNQSIGNYPYQQLVELNQNYAFGGVLYAGAAGTTVPNPDITWEVTESTNFGIDLYMLENRFSMTVDYFIKKTSGILYNISSSKALGATPSIQNAGVVQNKGWDIDLGYRGVVGEFSYGISTNLSIVKNEVLEIANVEFDIANGLFVGEELGSIYGYETDGLFIDANDVANYPAQPYAAEPGSVRYRDISGPEGVPDGVVSSDYDRHIIGSSLPNFMYGTRLQLGYKGFDMFALFAGEGGMQRMMGRYEFAFANNGNIQEWQWNDRWTVENPNPNATYPRLTTAEPYFETNSTFWMHNAAFLRLKNIEVGYTIPTDITHKISIESLRVYASGQNLLTFSSFQEGWDPEMNISGVSIFYPPTRVVSVGVSVQF
ncbi:MAG: TonB-dependent receptor [Cyclobacteriaceae bacterium]